MPDLSGHLRRRKVLRVKHAAPRHLRRRKVLRVKQLLASMTTWACSHRDRTFPCRLHQRASSCVACLGSSRDAPRLGFLQTGRILGRRLRERADKVRAGYEDSEVVEEA